MLSYYIVSFISKRAVKNVLSAAVILVTFVFIAKTLNSYYGQLQEALFSFSPLRIGVAVCLFIGYLYMRALSWRFLVLSLGASIDKVNGLSIWFFSEATRFIPGNVWSFASRVYLSRQKNLPKDIAILAVPVEIAVVAITATLFSLFAVYKNVEKLPINLAFLVFIGGMVVGLLGLYFLKNLVKRFLSKLIAQNVNPRVLLVVFLFQIVAWTLYGLGTITLIDNLNTGNVPLLFSSSLLAWLVGYLSFITPMGLGVREGAFIVLTGQQMGVPQAAFIALLSRAVLIVAELVNLIFWVVAKKIRSNQLP